MQREPSEESGLVLGVDQRRMSPAAGPAIEHCRCSLPCLGFVCLLRNPAGGAVCIAVLAVHVHGTWYRRSIAGKASARSRERCSCIRHPQPQSRSPSRSCVSSRSPFSHTVQYIAEAYSLARPASVSAVRPHSSRLERPAADRPIEQSLPPAPKHDAPSQPDRPASAAYDVDHRLHLHLHLTPLSHKTLSYLRTEYRRTHIPAGSLSTSTAPLCHLREIAPAPACSSTAQILFTRVPAALTTMPLGPRRRHSR